jgi:cytoskeletal protein CcmA (bactofilin family)
MLSSFKSNAPEKEKHAATNAAEGTEKMVQPQRSVIEQTVARPGPTAKTGTASCIGAGMSIVGKIECNGPAQVFGRIEGELHASELLISDGAQIEGSVIAQDLTVRGRIRGTVRAVRVKLQEGGTVEGDIFHRSLSIDENSLFEGTSRRVENPTDTSTSADVNGPQKNAQSPVPPPFPPIDADLQRVDSATH